MTEWQGKDEYGFVTIDTETRSRVSLEADCLYTILSMQAMVRSKDWDGIKVRHQKTEDQLIIATNEWIKAGGTPTGTIEYFMFRVRKHELQIAAAFDKYAELMQEMDKVSDSAKKYGPGARIYPQLIKDMIDKFQRTEAFRKALVFAIAQEDRAGISSNKEMLLNFTFEGTN